jgi:uncharacterized protein (DUF2062 family)
MDFTTIYRFAVIGIISGLAVGVIFIVAPLCVVVAVRRHRQKIKRPESRR